MQPADPFAATLQECVAVFMRRSMHNLVRYARESGLSISQVNALIHIHHQGGGVTDLGEHLGISSAAASQLLERLVQQELILRTEDPEDRRVKQLVLTEKGIQTIHEGFKARLGWLNDLAGILSLSEKDQISPVLHILMEKTQQLENPAEQY